MPKKRQFTKAEARKFNNWFSLLRRIPFVAGEPDSFFVNDEMLLPCGCSTGGQDQLVVTRSKTHSEIFMCGKCGERLLPIIPTEEEV